MKKAHGEPGVAACAANSPSVSCLSVQSSNTSERVKKPQPDAISEYIYSGVNQSLNRPRLPHAFPLFVFSFHDSLCNAFFPPWNNSIRLSPSFGVVDG